MRLSRSRHAKRTFVVLTQIEAYAEVNARARLVATSYAPPLTTTAARDRYCAANGNPGT